MSNPSIRWDPNNYFVCLGCGCLVYAAMKAEHNQAIHH